jgi:hypothetical protein
MARKDFEINVGKGGNAEDVTITHHGPQMRIALEGVHPEDILGWVTHEDIAEEVDLGELLVALVAKHGLNQLLYELMDNSETTAILDIVYDADDDTTRTWAIDKFASESE